MESIPHDLLIKISNLLSTRERARLAVVSKEWQQVVTDSWTTVWIEPAADFDEEDAFERGDGEHLAWLGRLARRSPHTLQSVYIRALPAAHDLLEFDLHCCTCLQRLELTPEHSGGWYPASITPEAMQRLSSLIHLEVLTISLQESSRNFGTQGWRAKELSLHGIAVLPKLQSLNLGLGSSVPWTLMHVHKSGFQSLKSLCINRLHRWSSEWMPEVISRLEALFLVVSTPIIEETNTSDAPKLTSLEFRCYQNGRNSFMPFRTSANLRMLSSLNVSVQAFLPSVNCNIVSLHLRRARPPPPSDIIRSWSTLTGLTELSVGCSSPGSIVQPFTCLSTLKRLSILKCGREFQGRSVFGPHDGIMENLTSLTISSDARAAIHVGEMASMLPALKEFAVHSRTGDLTGEICSSTLEVLSLKFSNVLCQLPLTSLLGVLPCLHTLSLRTEKGFHEAKAMLAQSLPALKKLRELSLLVTKGWGEALPGHDDTIDVVLGAISVVAGLTALKVFIPTSDINLSLVNFSSLMVFSVGCKAVHFDGSGIGSSLQRRDLVLDLLFSEASDQVFDQLRACQDSVVRLPAGDGLMFFNVRRRANRVVKVEPPFKPKDIHCFASGMVRYLRKIAGLSPRRSFDEVYRY